MAQIELTQQVAAQIAALVDAKVAEKLSATTRVVLGTAATEFERLYMHGEDAKLAASTFRQYLRFAEASLNARVAALVEQKWTELQNAQQST